MSGNSKIKMCRNCNAHMAKSASICPSCGARNKKPLYKRAWFIVLIIVIIIGIIGSAGRKSDEKKDKKAEYRWPTSELVSLIPQPEIKYGKINSENKDYFAIDIYGMSSEQFEDYIEACKVSGFTEDYSRFEGAYSANDVDGFSLMLTYNEKEKQMSIMLSAPDDESSESPEIVTESQTTEATESAETEVKETESVESAETEDIEAESAEPAEAAETETTESAETKDNEVDKVEETNLIDGMRPDFKEAMDSYEAFYIDYCDFMKKYTENPTDLGLITEYTDMIKKLADMDEKFAAWESNDLNSAEVKYYAEVQGRITQKILEIAE